MQPSKPLSTVLERFLKKRIEKPELRLKIISTLDDEYDDEEEEAPKESSNTSGIQSGSMVVE